MNKNKGFFESGGWIIFFILNQIFIMAMTIAVWRKMHFSIGSTAILVVSGILSLFTLAYYVYFYYHYEDFSK